MRRTALGDRIAAREFDDPDVREALDQLTLSELIATFGQPATIRRYAEPPVVAKVKDDPSPRAAWEPGDGRPALADDDPAVMQMIGRCAVSRIRGDNTLERITSGAIHPDGCEWDAYPLEELVKACAWAVWHARHRTVELHVWRRGDTGEDRDVTYAREGDADVWENPAWASWWAMPRRDRAHRLEQPGLGIR